MEYLVLAVALALFVIVVFVKEAFSYKKKEKAFVEALYNDFGKIKEKEYALERYARMGSFYERHENAGQIDDITWNDLNMDQVFMRMNGTFSAVGEEYLYYVLRNATADKKRLEHLEAVMSFFDGHPDERVKVQFLMHQLGYLGKFSIYDYLENLDILGDRSNKKELIADFLFLPLICLLPFAFSYALMGIVLLMVYNITTYFKEKKEIDPYIISFAYVMRLMQTTEKLLALEVPVCAEEWEKMKTHKNRLKVIRAGSFWVLSGNRTVTTGNPLDILMDYLRMIFHVDLIQFNRMLKLLRQHIGDVDVLVEQVGFLDSAVAITGFRRSLNGDFCIPQYVEGDSFVLENGYHPLLSTPVKNSITAKKGILLTGSNASGKSTFLKTAAINAVLAQTIHTCTASCYQAPFFHIYSSMALKDSIESGESYYIVEIKSLKRILDAAAVSGEKVLCFVDEVLRGTNTVERIAASTQILRSLSGKNIMCFAATHDIELTELLKEEFDNYHFEEEVRDGDVYFNYKLLDGKATTRNAIRLLEIMGYDESIIQQATSQAQHFTDTGKWGSGIGI